MSTAAMTYTARQPAACAMRPENVRASRMPRMRPLMTLPTTRPRSASGARVAANGTSNCAMTEVMPITAVATMKRPIDGAAAATASPATVIAASVMMRRRRSKRSPSGSIRIRPAAYPICAAVTMRPAVASDTPNRLRSVSSSGCAR